MSSFNLKPLAWALVGAGVAVMGSAGAFDLPSWFHHGAATAPAATAPATTNAPAANAATAGTGTPAALAAAAVQAGTLPVAPPPPLPPGQAPNYRAIVQQYGPAVVHVSVSGVHKPTSDEVQRMQGFNDDPFFRFFGLPGFNPHGMRPQEQEFTGLGSGFIISSDGLILTNAHVVREAKEVSVKLQDRREYAAKVLGMDTATDIAVLRIEAKGLPTVKLGNPSQLMVGDYVLAIGAPYGLDQTATQGIVSAKGRSLPSENGENYVPFIQSDAAINPGNSGGPLFDAAGSVVGINSQLLNPNLKQGDVGAFAGVGFSIPIDVALKVKDQIVATGKAQHARLGVVIQPLNQDLAESFGLERPDGALVSNIAPHSAAEKAGLKSGDVITKVDGEPVLEPGQLSSRIGLSKAGDKVTLEVWRDKKVQTVVATLGSAEEKTEVALRGEPAEGARLGLAMRPLNRDERGEVGESGLLVQNVDGPARRAGVAPGDVLLTVNGKPVSSVEDVKAVLATKPKRVALLIWRDGNRIFVPVNLG